MRKATPPSRCSWPWVLIASACSKPKANDDNTVSAGTTGAPEVDAPVVAAGADPTATTAAGGAPRADATASTTGAPAATTESGKVTGVADIAQAKAVGALVKPESTEKARARRCR